MPGDPAEEAEGPLAGLGATAQDRGEQDEPNGRRDGDVGDGQGRAEGGM